MLYFALDVLWMHSKLLSWNIQQIEMKKKKKVIVTDVNLIMDIRFYTGVDDKLDFL